MATAAEPWWHEYTPIVSHGSIAEMKTAQASAVRGVGYFGGWYGYWYFDAQKEAGWGQKIWEQIGRFDAKRMMYYDLGEVGDFAGFFTSDGRMKYNAWSLPWWNGKDPLTARWFGLQAFMQNVPWAPYPTAKAYGLPPFTTPDGQPVDDLYAVLTKRDLADKWKFEYSSNPKITDDMAGHSGLTQISGKQASRSDVQLGTGWETVRLASVDYANPQYRDFCCREIARLIPLVRPEGIHADNFGDSNLGYNSGGAFGLWSQHTFRQYLQRHFAPPELLLMGITNAATFDITAYIHQKRWDWRDPRWTQDPLWLCYVINKMETALDYHRSFFAAAKKAALATNLECAVTGNTIPFPLGGTLMKGACDIAHFEWSTVQGWWNMRSLGLPPTGRVGYVTRLGAAISDAPFCWPSIYVQKEMAGVGHENLHKVLAFDCLANRGLLDFGHWYLDGYSPGTPESAGFINGFIRANAPRISHRRYQADVAVIHSAWSELASQTIVNPVPDMFVDEYCGWCQFLGDTHRQWDVVLQQDLTATNLARFPIIVLPSVMTLTDPQVAELRRYVAGGGHLIATGLTGTRYGPDRYLAPRPTNALTTISSMPSIFITTNRPGVTYWRKDRDPAAAQNMAALLNGCAIPPSVTTDAPATVGVNLNFGRDANSPLLTLDLNNCDLVVTNDTLRVTPSCATTIRLPLAWHGVNLHASYVQPETKAETPLIGDAFVVDCKTGTARIKTPSFSTYLLVYIQAATKP